ncbi:MAG: PAS domain-containing protein [Stagnimonas sp.]|nr:PAS domain-containing protein [Stagnimonas sp.]
MFRPLRLAGLLTLALTQPAAASGRLALSAAEQNFIAEHPVLRFGADRAWPPVDFIDDQGRHAGLSEDVLQELATMTGLRFELVELPDWPAVIHAASTQQVDLLPAIITAPGREEYLRYTEPYLDLFEVIVTRDDGGYVESLADLDGQTVAMVRGFGTTELFLRDYPGLKPVLVANIREALETVAVGRAVATTVPLAVANYHIQLHGLTNLKIAAPINALRNHLRMGVRKDWPELASILSKALLGIPPERMAAIRSRWMTAPGAEPGDRITRNELLALAGTALLLLLTFAWALSLRREIGRRRAAQDRAEQAERRLRELAEGIPGAIWQFRREPDGRQHYTYLSEGIRHITGRTPEETNRLMQTRSFDSVHPDDLGRLQALMQRLTEQGGIDEERYRLNTASGEWKWVQVAARARAEADGALVWNGITLDASRVQQIEQELDAARQRMQELIDSVPGAVFRLRRDPDAGYRFDYVSEGVLRVTGRRPAEHLGDAAPTFQNVPASDRERMFSELNRSALDGSQLQLELRYQSEDGSLRHLSVRANVYTEPGGELVWTGVLIDVSQRRALEVALADAHARLDDIVANFPGAIWQMKRDLAGREFFTYMSDSIARITGRPAEATLNKASLPFEVMLPEDRERARELLYAAAEREETVVLDYRLRTASGAPRWVHVTASARREPDGEVVWNGVVLDATEQKRLEAELQEARRAAEAGSQAKSRFLANMSHEIRTPMNAVIGLSHLALDAEREPAQRERLGKISLAAKALLRLLNDILEFSKLEAGKLRLSPAPFALPELLDTLRLLAGTAATEKGLQFVIDMAPALPQRLFGDALRIQQVLLNLLANATKFTDSGLVRLRVSAVAPAPAGQALLAFEISDTGIGMSEAQLARVFDAFEQADDAISRRHGGTGLGLTISQELVRLMGGELSARSNPGAGTVFTVQLPLSLAEPPGPIAAELPAVQGLDLAACVVQLLQLLNSRDTAARSQVLVLRAQRAQQGQAEELDTLERQLSAYDFESAELELARLVARWGLSLTG